jgi:phage repressor protein C with HTH and peptisase S24 domain
MDNQYERTMSLLRNAGIPKRQQKRLLATICGISFQAVQQWEEHTEISTNNLIAIATYFNVRPNWLVTGKGIKDDSASIQPVDELIAELKPRIKELNNVQIASLIAVLASAIRSDEKGGV